MSVQSVLFVCTGNICRSPLAEGIFLHLVRERGEAERYVADSAGTGGWHQGDLPDVRSIRVAALHGIDITGQRARKIVEQDFERHDLILGLDRSHVLELKNLAPRVFADRIHLFSRFATGRDFDVLDPYYGDPEGFDEVYSMLLSGCGLLLDRLRASRGS